MRSGRGIRKDGELSNIRVVTTPGAIPLAWLPVEGGERWAYLRGRDDYAISTKGRLSRLIASARSHAGFILRYRLVEGRYRKYDIRDGPDRRVSVFAHRAIYESFGSRVAGKLFVVPCDGDWENLEPDNLTVVAKPMWGRRPWDAMTAEERSEAMARVSRKRWMNAPARHDRMVVPFPADARTFIWERGGPRWVVELVRREMERETGR